MNIFSKARVRTAVSQRTSMKFNNSHITTADFFQLSVPYIRHLIPGQSLNVNFSCFSRLAPMPVPTLGNLDIKHHAFFVPFRTVMPSWDDFITDTVHTSANNLSSSGIIPFAHRLNVADLTRAITSPIFSTVVDGKEGLANVDFSVVSGSSQETLTYYRFTMKGRAVYKILRQLGYQISTDISAQAYNASKAVYVSALPLLCLTRLYIDWYYPSQYVGDDNYNSLLAVLKHDPVNGYTLTNADIALVLLYLGSVCYDSDYFTSAFDNPAGPNQGFYSSFQVPDISAPLGESIGSNTNQGLQSQYVKTSDNGTPFLEQKNGSSSTSYNFPAYITKFALDSLHALSDYMKRHQLVGSRAVDRYLARFGVKLEQNDRSILLGSATQGVQLGAIMSNADTQGARLGDYAGQGYSNDGASFSFNSGNDYGIFFIVSTIMPRIGYVEGVDRNLFHLSKLDFFTPEFDNLGTQAISSAEVKTCGLIATDDANDIRIGTSEQMALPTIHEMYNRVFGFTPRYAEYKVQLDKLTGDFNLPRLSQAGFTSDSWHLFRLFDSGRPSDYVHSKSFLLGSDAISPASQYDRIFGVTNGSADHFVLVYNFNVSSSMPAKPLFDTYDFDDDKGRVIETEVGGVKVN